MASTAVMSAVKARAAANWTQTLIIEPNSQGETPTDGAPFLRLQYPLSSGDQISVGAPGAQLFREEGGIRFVLSIPRGQGSEYWQGQLETLLAAFRAKQFGGLTTYAPSFPTLDDRAEQGAYWLLTAVVPYTADILG